MTTTVKQPYYDQRGTRTGRNGNPERPWVVVIRTGRTGSMITHHRFHTEDQAIAFYQEQTR